MFSRLSRDASAGMASYYQQYQPRSTSQSNQYINTRRNDRDMSKSVKVIKGRNGERDHKTKIRDHGQCQSTIFNNLQLDCFSTVFSLHTRGVHLNHFSPSLSLSCLPHISTAPRPRLTRRRWQPSQTGSRPVDRLPACAEPSYFCSASGINCALQASPIDISIHEEMTEI